ncbi:hypothetical protein [Pseudonocardia alni]|uniref:Uncharacterized protein n=1 Tax=Pseudonocardia alni TaxID=33907 RepID=A0A852W339_PSEA5|nr:hypothetical protein [Pseudonocardia antarctica]NYG00366.1 hypothetical protein [Pseudonocardia antarctica]
MHADRAEVAERWGLWREAAAVALAAALDRPADPARWSQAQAAVRRLSRSVAMTGSPGRWTLPTLGQARAALTAAGVTRDDR